jgi:predicted ATPase/DNA-binding CsgD family transcriptional regulator
MSLTTAQPRQGNLPAEVTSFVGRRPELAEVKRLLASARLVTLIGVGGAGKTRLAVRVAADLRRHFPDGAWFVDLAALDDPALLAHTVSATLGLRDQDARWPTSALAEHLQDKRMLLVLDNCDHLRDACAELASAVLRQAPALRVLTTSRQTLGVIGEHVFPVPPLTLPHKASDLPPEAFGAYEAMSLFVDRARAVRPSFSLTDETVAAAVAVCQRLDGIPLAIELAAARLSALSVQDLLERLEDRYQLLVGGGTSVLPRHQTLRDLVGWSWNLCTNHEQRVWSSASVFRSGFDLSAAEVICADDHVAGGKVLDVLTALVEKSILTTYETGGHVRYRMLETLQQFGQAQLESAGQEEALLERHRAYYARLAREASPNWFGGRQKVWLDRLLLELGNIRVSLNTSFQTDTLVETGLELASDLWFFWIATGRTKEGRQWLESGLRSAPSPGPARTRALEVCAYLCLMQDDLASATPMIAEASSAARDQADPLNLAWATQLQAMTAMNGGDLAAAQPLFEEALDAHRGNLDLVGTGDAATFLALVDALTGRLDESEAVARDAIATCDSHGERWVKSYLLWALGLATWRRGNTDDARGYTRDALLLARDLDEPFAMALCFELLAWNAETSGDAIAAGRLLGAADGVLQRVGWGRPGVPVWGLAGLTRYHDECMTRLVDRMGSKLELAVQEGSSMHGDQAISAALGKPPFTRRTHDPGEHTDSGMLTKRETEVAELVAQGLRNKEIAAKLVISTRTAEAHVERILTKLGFSSRTQIAAWMVEHKVTATPPV